MVKCHSEMEVPPNGNSHQVGRPPPAPTGAIWVSVKTFSPGSTLPCHKRAGGKATGFGRWRGGLLCAPSWVQAAVGLHQNLVRHFISLQHGDLQAFQRGWLSCKGWPHPRRDADLRAADVWVTQRLLRLLVPLGGVRVWAHQGPLLGALGRADRGCWGFSQSQQQLWVLSSLRHPFLVAALALCVVVRF